MINREICEDLDADYHIIKVYIKELNSFLFELYISTATMSSFDIYRISYCILWNNYFMEFTNLYILLNWNSDFYLIYNIIIKVKQRINLNFISITINSQLNTSFDI